MLDATRARSLALGVTPLRHDISPSPAEAYAHSVVHAFAPMFGVVEPYDLGRAATVAAACDAFVRSVDYVTDTPRSGVAQLHAGALQFAAGLHVASEFNVPSRFFERLEAYLQEASTAERALWRHRGSVMRFTDDDLENLGRKNAVMKTAPAALAAVSGRWDLLPTAEAAFQDIAVAVQLVDDLLDWEEDLLEHNFTYPLTLAARSNGFEFGGDVSERVLYEAAPKTLSLAEERLTAALSELSLTDARGTFEIAREAYETVRDARRQLRDPKRVASVRELRDVLHPIVCYHP